MGIIVWILLGSWGRSQKFIMPGRDPGGFIITILIGIAGALVGGFMARKLGYGTVDGFDIRSIVIAVLGAILLLIIFRILRRGA